MANKPKDYESTVMRIAGNILSGCSSLWWNNTPVGCDHVAERAVAMARAIVEETKRTEPARTTPEA